MRIRSVVAENMFQDSNNLGRDGYKVRPAEIKENKTKKNPTRHNYYICFHVHSLQNWVKNKGKESY